MKMPASIEEFNELVTTHMAHRKCHGQHFKTRSEGEANFRLHYSSIAAIEPALREATELRESDMATEWEKLGLTPEAAKIAARVQQNEFTPKAVADYDASDWQALLDRRRK